MDFPNLMSRIRPLLLVVVLGVGQLAWAEITVLAGVNHTNTQPGTKIIWTLLVIGTNQPPSLTPPALTNARYVGQPQINITAELIEDAPITLQRHLYTIEVLATGQAQIGTTYVQVAERGFTIPSLLVEVAASLRPSASPDLLLTATSVHAHARVGQPWRIHATVYRLDGIRLNAYKLKLPNHPHFQIAKTTRLPDTFCVLQGRIYRALSHEYLLIPQTVGTWTIPACQAELTITTQAKGKSQFDELFGEDPFFQNPAFQNQPLSKEFGGQEEQCVLTAAAIKVVVGDK